MGNPTRGLTKSNKAAPFVLFGQPILTEKEISLSCSSDNRSSEVNSDRTENNSEGSGSGVNQNQNERLSSERFRSSDISLETGHCKIFMESEDVGRTVDLSSLNSYEELYRKLANMFGIESLETLNHVLYRDASGAVRQLGDEPFSSKVNHSLRFNRRQRRSIDLCATKQDIFPDSYSAE